MAVYLLKEGKGGGEDGLTSFECSVFIPIFFVLRAFFFEIWSSHI